MVWLESIWRRLTRRAPDATPAEAAMEQASAFGRQALRAIVGRKRRHDLVRRCELEELRQRRRQGLMPARAAQLDKDADFAASDLLDDPLEREKTLEKIDAIEAQMARHWWRGKVTGAIAAPSIHAAQIPTDEAGQAGDTHARTQPPLPVEASDFAPTRAATLQPPEEDTAFLSTQGATSLANEVARPVAPAATVGGVETELREAALLWARGQTEATLTQLLSALEASSEEGRQAELLPALDDAQQTLAGAGLRLLGPVPDLDARASRDEGRLVLDCTDWGTLDFAAAGSILNWVQARQAEGRRVELRHVRPLLAALFAALELDRQARIVPAA